MNDRLASYLDAHLDGYLAALRGMVEINSFTVNQAGVHEVGNLTAELFASLGFTARRVQSVDSSYGQHLFLSRPGRSDRHVALVSHLDTVFPPGEEVANNFHWRQEGDFVYGPGVADIKGGTVVAFMALDALRACHPEVLDSVHWLVAVNAAEEHLLPDFAGHVRASLPPEQTLAHLVFECGRDGHSAAWPLVTSRKGMTNFQVQVTGEGAHSGTGFWRGRNAILKAARLAQAVADLSNRDRERTVNIGSIAGGTVTNRVPHECLFAGEMRAYDPQVLHEGMESLRERVRAEGGATVAFTPPLSPWPGNPGSDRLLELFQKTGTRLGMDVMAERRGGLSDGNLLWDHAPTIDGLGPVGGHVHCSQRETGQEYVRRSSFVPKALLAAATLRELVVGGGLPDR